MLTFLADPDTRADELLSAFRATSIQPRLRDALLLHPRVATVDLRRALADWPATLRDRAVSVTDNRAILEQWAHSPMAYERAVVAMNPRCPADLAIQLATDPEPAVRANSACCPNLPQNVRVAMANRDPDGAVRKFIRWLMTTISGQCILKGERYSPNSGEAIATVTRIVTYGIHRNYRPPS